MPADLSNPFGPSCCEGTSGACLEPLKAPASAQSCGCDLGMKPPHLCSQHKFNYQLNSLVQKWREEAEKMWAPGEDRLNAYADALEACALNLEQVINE